LPCEEYQAEEVWTYEAAYRAAMLNNRLRLGITGFYNDYKDKQFAITSQQAIRIFNEPDAESYGMEFEAKYAVTPALDVMGGFGLLHTEIKEITATTAADILGNYRSGSLLFALSRRGVASCRKPRALCKGCLRR
jgi:outer membrane receptor protein involved in Fe transport